MSSTGASKQWQATQQPRQPFFMRFAIALRKRPFYQRMGVLFLGGFVIGGFAETFACKTGLYASVTDSKARRRHQLDEWVAEFQDNLSEWQKEDMQRAAAAKQLEELKAQQQRLAKA